MIQFSGRFIEMLLEGFAITFDWPILTTDRSASIRVAMQATTLVHVLFKTYLPGRRCVQEISSTLNRLIADLIIRVSVASQP